MNEPDDLLPEGLADELPREAAAIAGLSRAILDTMHIHGYDRVRPPLIEFERALAGRMAGEQDDEGPRRLFRFVDPYSLRMLAVRADITPQVGRIAATALAGQPRPLRLCYAGEVTMIRAPQLEPARQRFQLGAELIGCDNVDAASEVVNLAIEALGQAGLDDIAIDFTLPDIVDVLAENAFPLKPQQRDGVRRELDMKDAAALKDAGGTDYLPLLYAAGSFDEAVARLAQIDAGKALQSRIDGLRAVARSVGDRARLTLDPSERHGFEYQSWFGFTLYGSGARGALGRGGTYAIAGSGEVATGFSIYADAIADALNEDGGEKKRMVFLEHNYDEETAHRLRKEGYRTIMKITGEEDPAALGCTHILVNGEPKALA